MSRNRREGWYAGMYGICHIRIGNFRGLIHKSLLPNRDDANWVWQDKSSGRKKLTKGSK